MAVITTQQLNSYYENFKKKEITFTKSISESLGMLPKFILFKHKSGQIPCIIYSSSMSGAKILANLDEKTISTLSEEGNSGSLRYCFKNNDKRREPITFFVPSKITGISKYKSNTNDSLFFISLDFTQRPPNDLVSILGTLLAAMGASTLRKEERIIISEDTQRKLDLDSKNCTIYINNIPRNAILRDLSFSGAKIILVGNAKFLVGKDFVIKLLFRGDNEIALSGKILRHEDVQGRKDICALALKFHEEQVPMNYKIHLSNYFQSVRVKK